MESVSRRRALTLGGGAVLGGAGALVGVTGAEAATAWRRLVVVTANIGRDHKGQRERAIRDVRNGVRIGGVLQRPLVGWQEIGEGDGDGLEARWINKYFGSAYRNLFLNTGGRLVPVSVPKAYSVLDTRVTVCHGGKATVSPTRVITQVALARADDPKVRFVFANTHYVAGAFNGRQDSFEAWRREMWQRHFKTQRDVLAYWRARGYPVVWTGDVNRDPMPLLMPNREKRAFKHGIDQIGWVPGTNGTQVRLNSTRSIPMHVDGHNARVAVMQIRRV